MLKGQVEGLTELYVPFNIYHLLRIKNLGQKCPYVTLICNKCNPNTVTYGRKCKN